MGALRAAALVGLFTAAACAGEAPPPAPAVVRASTVVSLTFDDTLADQLRARPMLESRGLRATFYVSSSRFGGVGLDGSAYMSLDDARALLAAGHEIGGHTISHLPLPSLDPDEQRRQVCDDRARLLALGFPARHFAYPRGATSPETAAIVAGCGYDSARLTNGLSDAKPVETTPPADAFALPVAVTVQTGTTLAKLQGYVERAERSGGGWVPILMHHVCDDGCSVDAITPATLDAFLAWLAARRDAGTEVRTVGEVIGGPLRPAVPGPPPPGPRTTENLLTNPSLEATRDGVVAQCWQLGSGGLRSPAWSRSIEVHEGSWSEALGPGTASSAERRIASVMDQGGCAPAARTGHAYVASAWYVADGPVALVAYARASSGLWSPWVEGTPAPAAATWSRIELALPPAPPDVEAISVGLVRRDDGAMIADDFALVDRGAP